VPAAPVLARAASARFIERDRASGRFSPTCGGSPPRRVIQHREPLRGRPAPTKQALAGRQRGARPGTSRAPASVAMQDSFSTMSETEEDTLVMHRPSPLEEPSSSPPLVLEVTRVAHPRRRPAATRPWRLALAAMSGALLALGAVQLPTIVRPARAATSSTTSTRRAFEERANGTVRADLCRPEPAASPVAASASPTPATTPPLPRARETARAPRTVRARTAPRPVALRPRLTILEAALRP